MITQKYLKSILDYNPCTGVFTWKYRPTMLKTWNTRFAGKRAGSIRNNGYINYYRVIMLFGSGKYEHRLAWIYIYGYDPIEIDHMNGNGVDNGILNLRSATHSQNMANSYLSNRGVTSRNNKSVARIKVNGQTIWLGTFDSETEAQDTYDEAAKFYFGPFARCNRPENMP